MTRAPTPRQETRGEHRDATFYGGCGRCGLPMSSGPNRQCPPGFWMTDAEVREWLPLPEGRGERTRGGLEIQLGALPEPST